MLQVAAATNQCIMPPSVGMAHNALTSVVRLPSVRLSVSCLTSRKEGHRKPKIDRKIVHDTGDH